MDKGLHEIFDVKIPIGNLNYNDLFIHNCDCVFRVIEPRDLQPTNFIRAALVSSCSSCEWPNIVKNTGLMVAGNFKTFHVSDLVYPKQYLTTLIRDKSVLRIK